MRFPVISLLQRLALVGLLGLGAVHVARAAPDGQGAPDKFVQDVADETLNALKAGGGVKPGDVARVNQVVTQHILPYVDFEKTTRLSAGRYWRQATPEQQKALAEAFRGTLVRTYAGALTRVDNQTATKTLPFRGDPKADDLVVRTVISQSNGQNTGVDYRLEKTASGWKIYDLNVENIWLIQNYRNQFAQEINQNGIDGLIKALNQRNK
ncbi:MlaC/ttg2D family ABC transporter substrate-binding protein [Achromobacter aloeverae]|uniref:ABC transporter n=1 Tax=Achromobacter aloeverae TaxID=1750518 RepID=A0A4Q1HJM0_9BURK|nr:ABC transporter substrate-binding protein [Achromobacter aloeverae]RXN90181.1 ABC transporter [Achromobacter aloeverae]